MKQNDRLKKNRAFFQEKRLFLNTKSLLLKQTIFLIVVISLFIPIALYAQQDNLVTNSSFEADTAGNLPAGYEYWNNGGSGTFVVDENVGYKSQKSAKISGATSGGSYGYTISVLPGEIYRVESLCKQSGEGTPSMYIYWRDENNNWNWSAGTTNISYRSYDNEWKKAVANVEVPATGVAYLTVLPSVAGQLSSSDTVWFDNVIAKTDNLVINSKFEIDTAGNLPTGYEYWNNGGSGTFVVDGNEGYKSQKSAKISGATSGGSYGYTISVLPGETYSVQSLCKQSGAGTPSMYIYWRDENNNWNWSAGTTNVPYETYDGEWKKAVANVEVPATGVAYLTVLPSVAGQLSSTDAVWFDNVSLLKIIPMRYYSEMPAGMIPPAGVFDLTSYNLDPTQNEINNTLRMGALTCSSIIPFTQAKAEEKVIEMREKGYNAILTEGYRYLFADAADNYDYPDVLAGTPPLAENIANTKILADACHKYGLKLYLHLTMSAVPDGFAADHPAWMTTSIDGGPVRIWSLLWACLNNDDFVNAYYQKLGSLIQGSGADGLMVDETSTLYNLCGCNTCRTKFTADTGYVMGIGDWLGDLQSPIYKAFLDWRIKSSLTVNHHIRQMLRSHKPDGILLSYYALPHYETSWSHGLSFDSISQYADIIGWEIIAENILGHWPLMVANLKLVRAVTENSLVNNIGFETDTAGNLPTGYEYWNNGGSGTFVVDGNEGYKSQKSAKISGATSGGSYGYTISVLPGETYSIQSLCKQSGAGTPSMYIYWRDENNNWNWSAGITNAPYETYDGEWKKAVANVEVPATGVAYLTVLPSVAGQLSSTDTVWFDNVKIKGKGGNIFVITGTPGYPDMLYSWLITLSQGAHRYWNVVECNAPFENELRVELIKWERRYENFMAGLQICADTAVLFSSRSNNLTDKPSGYINKQNSFFATCSTLSLAHIPYKVIVDKDILSDDLSDKANTIVMMNTGTMSDAEAANIRRFVGNGGTLICSAETSLYDENGVRRNNFALADLFGCNYNGTIKNGGSLVIDTNYPVLGNLSGIFNQPDESCNVTTTSATVLGYLNNSDGVFPSLLLNNYGSGKVIYFTGHPETTLYLCEFNTNTILPRELDGYGTHDLEMAKLLCNIVTNASDNDITVENLPPGVVVEAYSHAYKGASGIQVHLLNLTGGTIAGNNNHDFTFPGVVLPNPAQPIKIRVRNRVINNAFTFSLDTNGLFEIPITQGSGEVICDLPSFDGRYLIIYFNQGDITSLQNLAQIPVYTY